MLTTVKLSKDKDAKHSVRYAGLVQSPQGIVPLQVYVPRALLSLPVKQEIWITISEEEVQNGSAK